MKDLIHCSLLIFKYIIFRTIDKIITKRCNEYLRKFYLNILYKYAMKQQENFINSITNTKGRRRKVN